MNNAIPKWTALAAIVAGAFLAPEAAVAQAGTCAYTCISDPSPTCRATIPGDGAMEDCVSFQGECFGSDCAELSLESVGLDGALLTPTFTSLVEGSVVLEEIVNDVPIDRALGVRATRRSCDNALTLVLLDPVRARQVRAQTARIALDQT